MKKITVISVVMFCLLIANITKAQDSVTVPYQYAGILSAIGIDTTLNTAHNTTFRAGVQVEAMIVGIRFVGRAIYTTQDLPTGFKGGFGQLWAQKELANFKISLGYQPRPISLFKMNPVLAHFEPQSKGIIPGPALGGKISAKFNSFEVVAGSFYLAKDKQPEYGLYMSNEFSSDYKIMIGSYYSAKTFGIASAINQKYFSLLGYYEKVKYASVFFEANAIVKPYLSIIHDHNIGEIEKIEIGITKTFSKQISPDLKNQSSIWLWL